MDPAFRDAACTYVKRVPDLGDQVGTWAEAEVKPFLVETLLDALGWDTRNPRLVRHEYPATVGTETKRRTTFCSQLEVPFALVEAKRDDLDDDAGWQVIAYARVLGCPWALATNGRECRLYGPSLQRSDSPSAGQYSASTSPPVTWTNRWRPCVTSDKVLFWTLMTGPRR